MPHYIFEARVLARMAGPVCGVDEAGRGPLAGPVVAAAVIFAERKRIPKGLNDSKQMTAAATTGPASGPRPASSTPAMGPAIVLSIRASNM